MRNRIDGLTIVAMALIFFMGLNVVRDQGWLEVKTLQQANAVALGGGPMVSQADPGAPPDEAQAGPAGLPQPTPIPPAQADPDVVVSPYEHFIVTQGLHGFSYGQMAIDITGGKQATIMSPINGVVSALYVDEWGNPTLMIENSHYQVLMLHGVYTVKVGDAVRAGQLVGYESNQGNTYDAFGQSCRGRDCGYHTHLNIFDKLLGTNANPLELISK
jgi:murein DD-endopeptidase MepM/ murein hydrolase activator NlpD